MRSATRKAADTSARSRWRFRLQGWEKPLFEWQKPDQFECLIRAAADCLGYDSLKRAGRSYREGFVASKFALAQSVSRVRLLLPLSHKPTPDFEVDFGNGPRKYEITEADNPNRRRGAESPPLVPTLLPESEWVSSELYSKTVTRLTEKKARKSYASQSGLIINHNAFVSDPWRLDLSWWKANTLKARSTFLEVWVFENSSFKLL